MLGVIIIIIVAVIIGIVALMLMLNRKKIIKLFKTGNCIVTGHKGRGKDILFSFVTNYRYRKAREWYISNVDYTGNKNYDKFDFANMGLGGNTYDDFLNDTLKAYEYKGIEKADFYIADAGVYLPSTYHDKLVKKYGSVPLFMAIVRHLCNSNVHCNIQNLGRLWDKVREQADYYIDCKWCKVLFGKFVIQQVVVYDTYESALQRLMPMKVPRNLLFKNKEAKAMNAMRMADKGLIKKMFIVSKLPPKSKRYDTRYFKKILAKGSVK